MHFNTNITVCIFLHIIMYFYYIIYVFLELITYIIKYYVF
jgi:hypothetical protein